MSRHRRRTYNGIFLFFTLIMLLVTVILSWYFLNENNYFKEYWPDSWKKGIIKKKKEKEVEEEINFNDNSFYSIYEHVASESSLRNISGYEDFTPSELLRIIKDDFVTSDFKETKETSSNGLAIYTLDGDIIATYLQRIFGGDISIILSSFKDCSATVSGTTGASLGGIGMTLIDYDKNSNTFKATFSDIIDSISGYATVIDRKIIKAVKKQKTIVVQDKIIYYSIDANDSRTSFTYKIYADPEYKYLLDSIPYTADTISTGVIDIDDYIGNTSTIEYVFRLLDGKYYYQSSKIKKG